MPYIDIKTNISVTKEKTDILKAELADVLASSFPGKTENWLMLTFTGDCNMYFAGNDSPCMMVDIAIFGKQSDASYDKMTSAVCDLMKKECSLAADRVYVKYTEYDRWGWNNMNF